MTVAGIGVGIIIVAVIWVLSLVSCLVFSQFDGPTTSNLRFICIIAAIIVTLVLWSLKYSGPQNVAPVVFVIYDETWLRRVAYIFVCGVALTIGLVLIFVFYLTPQKTVAPLKPWNPYARDIIDI